MELRAGWWECKIDNLRLPLPADLRDEFGGQGTWALEPEGYVVLYPTEMWQNRLIGVRNEQQFKMAWKPHDELVRSNGRIRIPEHIIKTLGEGKQELVVISMGRYLKILPKNGDNPGKEESMVGIQPMTEEKVIRAWKQKTRVRVVVDGVGKFGLIEGRQGDGRGNDLFRVVDFEGIARMLPIGRFYAE